MERNRELTDRRITFSIDNILLEHYPELVTKLFHENRIIIYKAECIDFNISIKYYGFSPCFSKVADGMEAAFYVVDQVTEELKNGNHKIIKLKLRRL